jgi:superfamily II DNA helicase RecQ
MTELSGHAAFERLGTLLSGSDEGDWSASSPAIERLRVALTEIPLRASPLDLAVLLRQALAHEHERRHGAVRPTLKIVHPRLAPFREWDVVGLDAHGPSDAPSVSIARWQPGWLAATEFDPASYASSEHVLRDFGAGDAQGDPFLAALGRQNYRSPGQRAAVRAALSTPAGGTLIVALPTGEGKSMIFQLAQKVGFTGSARDARGVTLVIVPTVALAINHEQEAVSVCGLERPLAYQGGDEAQNAIIANGIADGSLGLCFASPEAACGRLRGSLRAAAERGLLRALVIDEAHLVDQWGTGFRTEFQELSGLRRELIAASRAEERMRTLLLSATLTDSSLETLRSLFGTDGAFDSIAAVQLRPEPDYWIANASSEEVRAERVMDALYHAPRPLVLYSTEVHSADRWYEKLRTAGFSRIARLTGKTGRQERERIVENWRQGQLDIVVGTSAFGLGIDYPHARSVVHACVPETLDRFYQEVGRGGRDGKASLSLIVPSKRDFATAEQINRTQVISVERGLQRWQSMFRSKLELEPGRYAVRIDARPGTTEEDIDMFGDRNTDWNLRTLALLARAGVLRLLGSPHPKPEPPGDWLEIDLLSDEHLGRSFWNEQVEPLRKEVWRSNERNLDLMRAYLKDDRCPAEIFEDLYGADRVSRACSRCSLCRKDPKVRKNRQRPHEPRAPWLPALDPLVERLLGHDGRLLVTYEHDALPRSSSRRLATSLQRLSEAGVSKLLMLGEPPFDMDRVLEFAKHAPFFVSRVSALAYSRLPNGPELIMAGENSRLEPANLAPQAKSPRIFILPSNFPAPDGRPLKVLFGGRTIDLDEFHARVTQ